MQQQIMIYKGSRYRDFQFPLRNVRMEHRKIVSASHRVAEDVISIRSDPEWKEPHAEE